MPDRLAVTQRLPVAPMNMDANPSGNEARDMRMHAVLVPLPSGRRDTENGDPFSTHRRESTHDHSADNWCIAGRDPLSISIFSPSL